MGQRRPTQRAQSHNKQGTDVQRTRHKLLDREPNRTRGRTLRAQSRPTIKREPVVLGGGQRGQGTGLVLKHHRVGQDLVGECHLQRHQARVVS